MSFKFTDSFTSLDLVIVAAMMIVTILPLFFFKNHNDRDQATSETQNKDTNPPNQQADRTAKKLKEIIDYLIMGRRLSLPFFVASLVSTWYGGILGVTQISYESGIYNFVTQGVFWYITYIIFAIWLVPKISAFDAVTLPDLVSKMFGEKSGKLASYFNFFNVLPIAYTISLGLLIQALTGLSILPAMMLGVSVVLAYSFKGGFRSVVLTDSVQFLLMMSGVLAGTVFLISNYGGFEFLKAELPPTHFKLDGGIGLGETFAWGLIALSTLVDPNFYQRVFAAKSSKVATRGILISVLFWMVFDFCTTTSGMYARALLPDVSSNTSYLQLISDFFPNGLRGFVFAGVLCTVLSTLDSYLFLAGSTLSYDILKKRASKFHTQVSILFVGIVSIVFALVFEGDIKAVWKTLGSYSASCLLGPVMMGYLFPKRFSDRDFLKACMAGVLTTTIWRLYFKVGSFAWLDEIYVGLFATLSILFISSFSKRNVSA